MFVCKKEFLTGLLIATISVSAATNIASLYAVEKRNSPEVEFSQRIGLFDSELLSEKTLRSNIAEIAFYRGLNLILVDKGIVDVFNTNNLEQLGITQTTSPMSSLTRKKAAETIMRAMLYAQNKGMLEVSNGNKLSFKDYVPEEKYEDMLTYAIENKVFKGTGKNMFKPNKKLTVREALAFLKNLYELKITENPDNVVSNKTVVNTPMSGNTKTVYVEPDINKYFKDINSSNTMAPTIKKLINAGAFDITNLNNELSLPKSIKNLDYALICKGMLHKAGRNDLIGEIDSITDSVNPDSGLTRNTAVKYGAVMSDVYPHKIYDIKVFYTDVKEDSPEDIALKKVAKSGIKMGYADGSFKGHEKVSRYEALNLLGIIVGNNVDTKIKVETVEERPTETAPTYHEPEVNTSHEDILKKLENKPDYRDSTQATRLEQQLKNKYNGLSFQERIEMRKKELQKILNK